MGSRKGSKPSKSASAATATHHDDDELLVTKGSSKSAFAASSSSPQIHLKVNQKFAQAFEERKRKEELTALERRGTNWNEDDDDESDSETEDEDGEELTRELDADISKTLKLIRKKDPAIYDSSIAFFKKPEGESDSEEEGSKKSKKKDAAPLYYKDLVRQQAIAGDVSGSEDEEEDGKPVQTYAEEQAQIKKDFLASLKNKEVDSDEEEEQGDDLDGGLFTVRKKTEGEEKQEEEDFAEFTSKYGTKLKKDDMDPEKFLEHYLSSEGWKDKTDVVPHYEDIVKEDEEDAEELEKAEDFEHTYNFRFEEQGSSVIQTHARHIEDTMRREDDSRKRKRAERKERKALERQKKEEKLRRLKNLKQAEIQQKLKKVARLMGEDEDTVGLKPEDLEGDFDPEEYDKRMQAVFDEQYYDEDDDDMEKPTWDEEEDKELFAGLPVDPEDEEEEESTENAAKPSEEDEVDDDDEEEQDEEQEEDDDEAAPPKKMTREEMQREKQKYLDELYSLDYEDLIGDIKCRFKYRQVQNNDFGLTVDEIMAADDKELKQLVSLKRMAPYTDMEYSVDRKRLKNFKKSVREAQEENRRRKHKAEAAEASEAQNGESEQPKKKRKRNKKKQAVEEEDAKPEENEAMPEADDDEEHKPKSKKAKKESTESTEKKTSDESDKKKKRRSKKKKGGAEKNSYASTGLPTSRLESYKLVKANKK